MLTDFSLSEGDGFDLAHRFRVLHPQAAIILVSGAVAELDGRTVGLEHFAMLAKPFKFDELHRMIRTLLADTPPTGDRITPTASHGKMGIPLNSG